MATIICKINLGIKMQQVYIESKKYSDKKIVETYQLPIDDLATFIAKHEDVKQARLSGPKFYLEKIEKDTKEIEMRQYSKEKTVFYYI